MVKSASKLDRRDVLNVSTPSRTQKTNSKLKVVSGKISFENTNKNPVKSKVQTRKRKESLHPLRDLRLKLGCTLEELAKRTKMSPSYLSRLESGSRRLNEDLLESLSNALECDPAELLTKSHFIKNASFPLTKPQNSNIVPDFPIFSINVSESGIPSVSESPDRMMPRPEDFNGVKGAFACQLDESCWEPRYCSRDVLLIHPTMALKDGCSVFVKTIDNKVFIGTYKAIESEELPTEFTFKTSYSNDVKEITLPLKEVEAYRITGTLEE